MRRNHRRRHLCSIRRHSPRISLARTGGFEKLGISARLRSSRSFRPFWFLAQAFWIDPIYWAILRLICGVCTAGVFIVIESWLLMQSPPSMRGAVLSLYLAVFYAALSAGQFLINLSDPRIDLSLLYHRGLFRSFDPPYLDSENRRTQN